MAHITTFPGTRYQPSERMNSTPIHCAACGAEWDEEDDLGAEPGIDMEAGELYCVGACLNEAREQSLRRRSAAIVQQKIDEALEALRDLAQEYSPVIVDDENDPHAMLTDLRSRVKMFGEGRDSGWRGDGVMLDYAESLSLRNDLDELARMRRIEIAVRLRMIDHGYMLGECDVQAARTDGAQIGKLGRMLLTLQEQRDRAANGGEL